MTESTELHVVETAGSDPAAPTVVIVHGALDRSASFGRVARQLRDLHVIRYDRRGYGRSSAVPVGSLDDHVEDLLGLINGRNATVFGHSIGGVVALVAAQRAPDQIRSVLAFEAPTPWEPWWPKALEPPPEDPADEAEAFMRRAIGDHYWGRLPAQTRADRRAEGGALRADIASIADSAPFEARTLLAPVVAAAGSETTWWHRRAADELALDVPVGELQVIPGATHGAHLTHPSALAELVRSTVAQAR